MPHPVDSSALRERILRLCELHDELCGCSHPVIVLGDFNVPGVDWRNICSTNGDSRESHFVDICVGHGLYQLVDQATRPSSGNLLDLLLTTDPMFVDSVTLVNLPVASDHLAIPFSIVIPGSLVTKDEATPVFGRADYDAMSVNLCLIYWELFFRFFGRTDAMYEHFAEYVRFLVSIFVPCKSLPLSLTFLRVRVAELIQRSELSPSASLARKLQSASRRLRILEESRLNICDGKSFFRFANKRLRGRDEVDDIVEILVSEIDKAKAFGDYCLLIFSDNAADTYVSSFP